MKKEIHIWDEWPYEEYKEYGQENLSKEEFIARIKEDDAFAQIWGDLRYGTYGSMWRNFPGINTYPKIDQIWKIYDQLIHEPNSRRIIVNSWHPELVDDVMLPPCHVLFQFKVEELEEHERPATGEKYRLNLQLYQRSADLFLGVPFNIASYSLLLLIFCKLCQMIPGEFVHTFGDLHIYENHLDQVNTQLGREPKELPTVKIEKELDNLEDLFTLKYEDLVLENYKPHGAIKAEVAV